MFGIKILGGVKFDKSENFVEINNKNFLKYEFQASAKSFIRLDLSQVRKPIKPEAF